MHIFNFPGSNYTACQKWERCVQNIAWSGATKSCFVSSISTSLTVCPHIEWLIQIPLQGVYVYSSWIVLYLQHSFPARTPVWLYLTWCLAAADEIQPDSLSSQSISPKSHSMWNHDCDWRGNTVGNTRHQAVIIYGQSVKGFKQVICYENERDVKLDLDVDETKHYLVSPESAIFCAHRSHFGMLYNCYQKEDFPTGHVMKKCPNHCLFSIYWRLSFGINGISSISISYLVICSISKYK